MSATIVHDGIGDIVDICDKFSVSGFLLELNLTNNIIRILRKFFNSVSLIICESFFPLALDHLVFCWFNFQCKNYYDMIKLWILSRGSKSSNIHI